MDAASLHDSLRTKLNHLEAKLEAHRQDLLGEFHQHYHDLTRGATPSALSSLQDGLQAVIGDYKILRPSIPQHPPVPPALATTAPAPESAGAPAESPPPPVSDQPETATTFQTLLLASPAADSGNPDPPSSPRDRDHELQGLFTPSYLPLLAASPIHADNTPVSPTTTTQASAISSPQTYVAANGSDSVETGRLPATESTMDESAEEHRLPGRLTTPPRHRPSESEAADSATADDTNSSASSDKSDNKAPRSALRRYSSTYKSPQSPRRVRFEFMGAEFLPTASPQPSDNMMPRSSSPAWEGENVTVDSVLGGDDDDLGPPPKKISSSDMLRALSREPLEEGTVWTVVNPDSDNTVTKKMEQVDLNKPEGSGYGMQEIQQEPPSDDADAADEDGLDMKKTRVVTPPPVSKPSAITNKAALKNKAPIVDSTNADDDDMFQFEDESGRTSSPQRPPPAADEDEHSENESAAGVSASDKGLGALRSPTTVAPASVPAKVEAPEPTTPTTPRFHVGSVGSYKGRSIIMPVVKSPEVHAKAASIGNFNSFVGGLDGTSGMDPADLSSYRASFMRDGFSGTPRSFTERLMMEDMEAERLKEQADRQ
ncbi:hypothetical protein PWT90_06619 [Aphanocladium album]|nr:hypothetical protein PWT90_06619 [Aphanocladium album]